MDNTLGIGLFLISNSVTDSAEKAMLARWRKEYEAFQERNRKPKEVLAAILEGYDTISEISAHTNIPITTVHRIIKRFIHTKRLRSTNCRNHNDRIEKRLELI